MSVAADDLAYLRRAVAIARDTMTGGRGRPFGAVIVRDGTVLGEGANTVRESRDPTAHAETAAIRAACQGLGTDDLAGSTIYASGEPCPMCLGAIYLARVSRVVYATTVQEASRIGNLSEMIYGEFAKPPAARSVPALYLPLPEASALFDAWRAQLAAVIEPLAIQAWPARATLPIGGWLARFTDGCSHRGNSVVTFGPATGDIEARITAVERAYAERGLVPMFHVTPLTRPADLEERLAARGYRSTAPTHVCVADTKEVAAGPPSLGDTLTCAVADPRFRNLVAAGSHSPADGEERLDILGRLAAPHANILALDGTTAVACGVAVQVGDWACLCAMRSHPDHRRRGHARRVLGALAAWAQRQGASRLFLQVEDDNTPARALYEGVGFRPAYAYRFMVRG